MNTATAPGASAHAAAAAPARRAWNFCAGPSVLPDEVIRQAQSDLWDIAGTGMGILEHSHRAKLYDKVLAEAVADCRKIANIPENYHVLFLTGGATSQNYMVPANLLAQGETADYLTTGYWAEKSAEQAKMYGTINEAWNGAAHNHAFIPTDGEVKYSAKPSYVHMCTNNTIFGTQWRNADGTLRLPAVPAGVPIVADMSSDIYSRPMDVTRFGLIYAGAQKNIGVAGTTLVIIRDDLLQRKPRELPGMLQYRVHAKDESRHNTPPVYAIYMCGLMFKWILRQGGLEAIHARNMAKAAHIYAAIDESGGFYKGHARNDSRSLMNITFRCPTEQLDEAFIKEAQKNRMEQLKGHRSTGGMRASTYNAMPEEGCKALAQFMRDFAKRNG
jgi:phosphoserine aminotransferase